MNSIIFSEDSQLNKIPEDAFYCCSNLTNIVIPEGVKSIGTSAFYKCINLTSITLPNSVSYIGHYAFGECTALRKLIIPKSVTEMGGSVFKWCSRNLIVYFEISSQPEKGWNRYWRDDFNGSVVFGYKK